MESTEADQGTRTERTAPSATAAPLAVWSASLQLGLAFLVTASVFFFLGRWSKEPPPVAFAQESAAPSLDLNQASRAELRLIPGIGDALAQRIIDSRAQRGPFKSVDELRRVSGIGPKTLERIRPYIYIVPGESFVAESEDAVPEPMTKTAAASRKEAQLSGSININRADQAELQKLPGIGPKLSQRILDERAKAPFKAVEELRRVPGIGPKTLEKVRPYVVVE
jgi:competence protein ComEA